MNWFCPLIRLFTRSSAPGRIKKRTWKGCWSGNVMGGGIERKSAWIHDSYGLRDAGESERQEERWWPSDDLPVSHSHSTATFRNYVLVVWGNSSTLDLICYPSAEALQDFTEPWGRSEVPLRLSLDSSWQQAEVKIRVRRRFALPWSLLTLSSHSFPVEEIQKPQGSEEWERCEAGNEHRWKNSQRTGLWH